MLTKAFQHVQCSPEAEKPKTFRVATFYTQKLSGRSARNRFSRQAKKARFCLSRHCQRMHNECPWATPRPPTESQQILPNRAKNGVCVLNEFKNGPKRP